MVPIFAALFEDGIFVLTGWEVEICLNDVKHEQDARANLRNKNVSFFELIVTYGTSASTRCLLARTRRLFMNRDMLLALTMGRCRLQWHYFPLKRHCRHWPHFRWRWCLCKFVHRKEKSIAK